MKICYLCADRGISLAGHSGASVNLRNLVRTFSSLNHEVFVVTPSTDGGEDLDVPIVRIPSPRILDALLSDARTCVATIPIAEKQAKRRVVSALGHVWNNIMVEQTLQAVIPRYRPDLLFERYSPFCAAGGIVARRLGVRHILNVHAPLARQGKEYRQQALQEAAEALEQAAYNFASLIVANSRELRDELLADGVAANKIKVISNGVDVEMFRREGPAHRQDLEGKIVIGFVGSLRPWHGVEILAEAFRELTDDPRLHLLIVGDGPKAEIFKTLARELPGRVTLAGAVPQRVVANYTRAMDIAVAPYPPLERFYFTPLKVLEYMACGRAIVAARIGQINGLIRDGETGLLVSPGDARALVEAIRRLVADQNLRQELGARAAAEARREHTWAQRASEIVELARTTGLVPAQ